jgi:hypothetical protein
MQEVQDRIPQYFAKSLHDHGNSELVNAIEIGLASCLEDQNWKADVKWISGQWKTAIEEQNNIGWTHVYKGRLSKQMLRAMDQHYDMLGVDKFRYNGERWARQLITNLWKIMIKLWKTRAEIIYSTNTETKKAQEKEKVKTRIQRCYEFRDRLPASERTQWFSNGIHELLKNNIKFLNSWLSIVERLIRINRREQKARPPESKLMEQYFSLYQTGRKTKARYKKNLNPCKLAQEMQPD